jgi:hypothetical protein
VVASEFQSVSSLHVHTAPYIQFLPADVQKEVEEWGIEFALNLTYALTAPYIPSHYTDMVSAGSYVFRQGFR